MSEAAAKVLAAQSPGGEIATEEDSDSDDDLILKRETVVPFIRTELSPIHRPGSRVKAEIVDGNSAGDAVDFNRSILQGHAHASMLQTPRQDRLNLKEEQLCSPGESASSEFQHKVASFSPPIKRERDRTIVKELGSSLAAEGDEVAASCHLSSKRAKQGQNGHVVQAKLTDLVGPTSKQKEKNSSSVLRPDVDGNPGSDPMQTEPLLQPPDNGARKKFEELLTKLQNTRGIHLTSTSLNGTADDNPASFFTSEAPPLWLQKDPAPLATDRLQLSPSLQGHWTTLWHGKTDLNDEHMALMVRTGGRPLLVYEDAGEDDLLPAVPAVLQQRASASLLNKRVKRQNAQQLQSEVQHVTALRGKIVNTGQKCAVRDYGIAATAPHALGEWQVLVRCELPAMQTSNGEKARDIFFRKRLGLLQHTRASEIAQYLETVGGAPPCDALHLLPAQTVRVQQTLNCQVSLPPESQRGRRLASRDRGWCRVESLRQLSRKVEEGRDARRLVIVAAAEQASFWETCFVQIAAQYPRVLFVSITASAANAGQPHLRQQILRTSWISGVHFVSITPFWTTFDGLGEHVRAFCGNDKNTESIMEALVNRYQASVASKLLPELEPGGLRSNVEVNALAAEQHLLAQLRYPPMAYDLSLRYERGEQSGSGGPFAVQSCAGGPQHQQPPGFKVALREEQLRSLEWMVRRERDCATVVGELRHVAGLDVPPMRSLALHWRLRAEYQPRGGILADSISYGKTAVALALVASQALPRGIPPSPPAHLHLPPRLLPSRATLVMLPPHLLTQWAEETRKFCGDALHCIRLDSAADLHKQHAQALQTADIVLASHQVFNPSELDAAQRDRRYLCRLEGLWPKVSPDAAPELEMFYWHRVVVDEVHELVPPDELADGADAAQVWNLPPERLFARSRWGLTGTPPIQRTVDVDKLSAFLQVQLGVHSAERAKGFVDTFVRASAMEGSLLSAPVHHTINVPLTRHEMMLHRDARQRHRAATARGDAAAWGDLLGSCSHHSLGSVPQERRTTAQDQIEHTIAMRQKEVERLTEKIKQPRLTLQKHKNAMLEHQNVLRHTNFATVESQREAESKLQAATGLVEEWKDRVQLLEGQLADASKSLECFKSTVSDLQQGTGVVECPVCLCKAEISSGNVVITPCAHVYCKPCGQRILSERGRCATCNGELEAGSFKQLTKAEAVVDEEKERVLRDFGQFGSKIAYLISRLLEIRAKDPTAKCLVYCQFDHLSRKVLDALQHYGLASLSLQGSAAEMGDTLRRFVGDGGEWVLLCSLQKKAAGMNLQCASHLLFVHPFYARSADYTDAWEAQAIGRIFRQGQTKEVHVHRFVALGTVEQEMIASRDPRGCMKYLPSGSPLCIGPGLHQPAGTSV